MKKLLLVALLFLVACHQEIADESFNDEEINNTEEDNKDIEETPSVIDSTNTNIIIENEETIIPLNENLELSINSSLKEADYCDGECLVAEDIKINDTHLTLLEEMNVKINSQYGTTYLTNIDDIYILSFDPAAQYAGIRAVVFDSKGNILKEFDNIGLDLNVISDKHFTVYYPCNTDENCNFMENPFSSLSHYTVEGSTLTEEFHDLKEEQLDVIRNEAIEVGSVVSVAKIGDLINNSIEETFINTIYPEIYSFMNDIDKDHTVDIYGRTLYCIVPSNKDAQIIVQQIVGDDKEELYSSNDGRPIFVVSDNETIEVLVDGNSFMLEPIKGDTTLGTTLIHDFSYYGFDN